MTDGIDATLGALAEDTRRSAVEELAHGGLGGPLRHGPHARTGDLVTITFQPEPGGTRLSVHHRRERLRSGEAAAAVLGLWWGDRLGSFSAAPHDQQLS